jgi:hypothetical protein
VTSSTGVDLRHFVRDCASLHDDFQGLIDDLRLSTWRYVVRYAIDFSELYAYVFPEESANQLKMFSDDKPATTAAVQQYVLNKLLFMSDPPLVLLPTYAVELRSFVNFVRDHAVVKAMETAPAALQEIQSIATDEEFGRVEALIARTRVEGLQPSEQEWREILGFLETRAPTLAQLSEAGENDPVERLSTLLRRVRFEPLGGLVEANAAVDESNVRAWANALEERRRERSGSNYLDATSVELVRAANELLSRSNIRLRLITRSKAMHDVERQFLAPDAWDAAEERLLRHPRAFFALRRTEGVASEQVVDRVLMMQTCLEAVIDSYEHYRGTRVEGEGSSIAGMIAEIRGLLQGSAWLASVMAMAEVTETDTQTVASALATDSIQPRVLRLFAMIRDEQTLMSHLEASTRERAQGVDRLQQLLAVALQGQPEAVWGGANQLVQYEREGDSTVIKSKMYWMPYTLEFEDPVLQQWSREFEQRASLSHSDMLDTFRSGFARNLDYEMSLSLAYLVAAWGQWELALKFADLALTRQRLSPDVAAHEGKFFKALCLRMLGAETGAHYREARRLLQQARVEKRRRLGSLDARYVKETATLLFYWGETLTRTGGNSNDVRRKEQTAIRLSHRALELAKDDLSLTAQLYNNLCYYATNSASGADRREVREYLDKLEACLGRASPEQWPINFVDTVLWARCNLQDDDASPEYWRALIDTLERAFREQRIRPSDQDSIRKHLARARKHRESRPSRA